MVQAIHALAQHAQIDPHVSIHVEKSIPLAGGMAGGSADAAGTLVACDALWGTGLSREELADIGARLGSDVPFALFGANAIGRGRGEEIMPVLGQGQFHWVFALADEGLSTPAVYRHCDTLREGEQIRPPEVSDALLHALRQGDANALAAALHNDLQPAAISLRPSLRSLLEAGVEYGALAGVVSGSGPTCAFLCRDSALNRRGRCHDGDGHVPNGEARDRPGARCSGGYPDGVNCCIRSRSKSASSTRSASLNDSSKSCSWDSRSVKAPSTARRPASVSSTRTPRRSVGSG